MILDTHLQDLETENLIGDDALISTMLNVEAALARVQGRLGIIPKKAATQIDKVAKTLKVDAALLSKAVMRDGIPINALLTRLSETISPNYRDHIHWGTTSQDIVDTAMMLMIKNTTALFEQRLSHTVNELAVLADSHRNTVLAARTRNQHAVPTTLGLKIAGWIAPLQRYHKRLAHLEYHLQFGGAGGTLAALGPKGLDVAGALAAALELSLPPLPWHSQRDFILEIANWLTGVSGSLGKMAGDILMLAQTEVGEARLLSAGGSSAMPQKNNPILAEVVPALARRNAGLLSTMHQSALHHHERDGTAWTLEWVTLPDMIRTTGASLLHGLAITQTIEVDKAAMNNNLTPGLLAEAATYALAAFVPKTEAQLLVKSAIHAASETDDKKKDFLEILASNSTHPINWEALRDPTNYLGAANSFIDTVLKEIKK